MDDSRAAERAGAARNAIARAVADALALAFPVVCAGCAAEDTALCERCRGMLRPDTRRQVLDSGLVVHAGLGFRDVPARVIRALKEDGRTGLARALAPALAAAVGAAVGAAAVGAAQPGRGEASWTVVPVPTSRAAMRRRGFRVVELVARRAGLRVDRLLRSARATADQRALGRDERRRNVDGSMAARDAAGRRILLIDDVVTTGATLREAAGVLRAAGASEVVAAVVAATPRRYDAGWPPN